MIGFLGVGVGVCVCVCMRVFSVRGGDRGLMACHVQGIGLRLECRLSRLSNLSYNRIIV